MGTPPINSPAEVLKKFWNFDSFRPMQMEIIESVLRGRDTLALLPTGGGKSLCFQVPSLLKEGICLVITPLVALIRDQTDRLKSMGIPALYLHSGMNYPQLNRTLQNAAYGNYKFLYLSPERLQSELFQQYLPVLPLNLIAVDEAHCISQWGYDFRPSYLKIEDIRKARPEIPVLALTASATLAVQSDICQKLNFRQGYGQFSQSFARPNLAYRVVRTAQKASSLFDILHKVDGSALVYCRTRGGAVAVDKMLGSRGIRSGHYHAGLSPDLRASVQDDWMKGRTRVMCATSAFGMGIDKPDVGIVIHYDCPDSLENYYQEAGRAGRDGRPSHAVLFFDDREREQMTGRILQKFPPMEMIRKVYAALVNYLQLPQGSGEGQTFDFNLVDFVSRFTLEPAVVSGVLHLLEQESQLVYQTYNRSPAYAAFVAGRQEMDSFSQAQPGCAPVLEALLRLYPGIRDGGTSIVPERIAGSVGLDSRIVGDCLRSLQAHGIIHYRPSVSTPRLFFLQNRSRVSDLQIHTADLLKRKEAYEARLRAIWDYAANTTLCRSRQIAGYFNGESQQDCKICDNCRKKYKED